MYQAIHHTHYQQNRDTRSIEDFLNEIQKDYTRRLIHNGRSQDDFSFKVVAVNLVKTDWSSRHYQILQWHVIIWCTHRYTDDELSPMLHEIKEGED